MHPGRQSARCLPGQRGQLTHLQWPAGPMGPEGAPVASCASVECAMRTWTDIRRTLAQKARAVRCLFGYLHIGCLHACVKFSGPDIFDLRRADMLACLSCSCPAAAVCSTESSIFGLPIMSPELWVVRWWDGFMTGLDLTYTGE